MIRQGKPLLSIRCFVVSFCAKLAFSSTNLNLLVCLSVGLVHAKIVFHALHLLLGGLWQLCSGGPPDSVSKRLRSEVHSLGMSSGGDVEEIGKKQTVTNYISKKKAHVQYTALASFTRPLERGRRNAADMPQPRHNSLP